METIYPFRLINDEQQGPLPDLGMLFQRPFLSTDSSFAADARRFVPGEKLEQAMNTALAVGEPLLITGEPGVGKTQAAHYMAWKLGIEPVIHFQVKSDSNALDLLYHFDTVRYFHDANRTDPGSLDETKERYLERRALWEAMKSTTPRVLLIDEIDKAPRDFPNDLLHELDKMEFKVKETGEVIQAKRELRPIVIITSNSERKLPEPFLRRCVYHHIRFEDDLVRQAVSVRRNEFTSLSDGFLRLALERFLALRERNLRKRPATGELLVWLRVLALTVGTYPEVLDQDLSQLPYLGLLLKDHQDIESLGERS
jgi:MoxR-like ATPase